MGVSASSGFNFGVCGGVVMVLMSVGESASTFKM